MRRMGLPCSYEAVSIIGLTPALAIECLKFISGDLNLKIDFDIDHKLAEDYLMKQVEYFQPCSARSFCLSCPD